MYAAAEPPGLTVPWDMETCEAYVIKLSRYANVVKWFKTADCNSVIAGSNPVVRSIVKKKKGFWTKTICQYPLFFI